MGVRGFSIGYDFYAPERGVCFHHYAEGDHVEEFTVPRFWDDVGEKYEGSGEKSMQRLLGIVRMSPEVDAGDWDHTEEAKYGLGGARTPELFFETFGIDVTEKTAVGDLCPFVDTGIMHLAFSPHLRSDGMGIDYSKIEYRYLDEVLVKK